VLFQSAVAQLPQMSISQNQGKLLLVLARLSGARKILEIGTLGGFSTIWLARALPEGGRLITIEVDGMRANVARKNIADAGLGSLVEIRVGQALDVLPQLTVEYRGQFDLVFIDADKKNCAAYFEWALKLTHSGSVIIMDDMVRQGTVIDANSSDPAVLATRQLFDLLATEKRVCAAAFQTVGTRGHDGLAIAFVTADEPLN
jgi:predicted O-methyltransferase YrrM